MKVPKPLKIKIPTETAQTSGDPDSPEYIPGITNQGPTTPDYDPNKPPSPAYDPNKPPSPTFGPNDPNPFTNTIQEVNLSDLKPEK